MECSVVIGGLSLIASGNQSLVEKWRSTFSRHLTDSSPGLSTRIELSLDGSLAKGAVEYFESASGEFLVRVPGHAVDATVASFYYRVALPVLRAVCVVRGQIMFHAGLASFGRQGILFVGPSGSGKTTLASALLSCGAAVHTDDQVLMWRQDGETFWDGLRRPLNLRPPVARAFFGDDAASSLLPYLPTSDKLALDVWEEISETPAAINEISRCIVLGTQTELTEDEARQLHELGAQLAVPLNSLTLCPADRRPPADFRRHVLGRLADIGCATGSWGGTAGRC